MLQNLNKNIKGEFVCLMTHGFRKVYVVKFAGSPDSPTSGTICFEERRFQNLPVLKRQSYVIHLSVYFQGFNLLKKHSVLENVMLPLLYSKVQRGKAAVSAKKFLMQPVSVH